MKLNESILKNLNENKELNAHFRASARRLFNESVSRTDSEVFKECKRERLSDNFESFVDEVYNLTNADELFNDEIAKNLIKKYNITWLYYACGHCSNYDRIRPSRLRSFYRYEDNPLAEGLESLYLMGNADRDGLLCRSCARSER